MGRKKAGVKFAKLGIDFDEARKIFDGYYVSRPDYRLDYGELIPKGSEGDLLIGTQGIPKTRLA